MKYTKKPVTIEAMEWTGNNTSAIQEFTGLDPLRVAYDQDRNGQIIIPTLEGDHRANVGDMIIRGVKGEYYPCKPGIFAQTYDIAKEKGMSFGAAVEAVKLGKKIAREGWNGKGMFAAIMPGSPDGVPANKVTANLHGIQEGELIKIRPYWVLLTAQGDVATWSPSGSDSLADDWTIVE